jgi:AcrR family transcriptional regulator
VEGKRTGRRPGSSGSRDKILASARLEFAARGYDGATILRIARRAGCDPALVHHFFGTKERLFDEAMELPMSLSEQLPAILHDADKLGENVARMLLTSWDSGRGRQIMLGLLRSAVSNRRAADRVRELIMRQAMVPALNALSVPDADLRASLIGANFVGLMIARHITRIEPLASLSTEELVQAFAPALQQYLSGDVGRGD